MCCFVALSPSNILLLPLVKFPPRAAAFLALPVVPALFHHGGISLQGESHEMVAPARDGSQSIAVQYAGTQIDDIVETEAREAVSIREGAVLHIWARTRWGRAQLRGGDVDRAGEEASRGVGDDA